jgi:hypothetical protein
VLCDTLRMTAGAVTAVYGDALRPLGLRVIAIAPGEDRRTRLVRVTPAGKKLLKEAVTRWRSVQASFKERLHDDEFDRTLRQLLRVRAAARP